MTHMNDTPVYGFTVRGNNLTDHAIDICHMLPASEQAKIARYLVTFKPTGAPLHEDLKAHLAAWGWVRKQPNPRGYVIWNAPDEDNNRQWLSVAVPLDPAKGDYQYLCDRAITIINRGGLL